MSHRLSLGGSALRDSSSRYNSRRKSLGGGSLLSAPSTPQDRRAMLDEWRRQQNHSSIAPSDGLKRKLELDLPPKHDVDASQGKTALERYRMRKQQKMLAEQQHQQQPTKNDENRKPPIKSTLLLDDDLNESFTSSATTTPSRRRGIRGGARRKSFALTAGNESTVRSNKVSSPLTQETEVSLSQPSLSQLTTHSAPTPVTKPVDTVEGADMRSRISEMQQRVDQLEKEKMALNMAKAPLEARFRQKEDAWEKEQNRLMQEIDSLKRQSQQLDEHYRDLMVKHDALNEECKKLREKARKATSSLSHNGDSHSSLFSRQLQNDRDLAEAKEKLRNAEDEINSLRLEKVSVEKDLNATRIELESLIRAYDELVAEYEAMNASKSANREAEIKLKVLSDEHVATAAQLNATCTDLAATKARSAAELEAKNEQHKAEVENLKFEISVLKTRAAKVVDDDPMDGGGEEDEAVLRARIEERDRRIADLESQLLEGEQIRRQMHNRIQELRGNIRVYVRTRPFLPGDGSNAEPTIEFCPDGETLSIADHRGGGNHSFKFDKIFPPSSGQDVVFQEVSDFVQSALDGYHVCLFSYGQTGSGKTHTMQGTGNGAMRGIIPRSVEKILSQAKVMHSQHWEFNLSASFLEIYNEELKDLLYRMGRSKSKQQSKLSIKRNREGKSYVEGLTEVKIDALDDQVGMEQLENLMASAARSRSVASTKMNAQSSRSHSVFMLHLRGYNAETGAVVHGALNLCDLAGSERLDRSGAGSDAKRLKETQAINKSLSSLGDVFSNLASGASHIPYRNSKLTYLLQDCLSGDGKALMFVNLSPTFASSHESLCSLRFAQRVNSVELGKATKHIQYGASKRK